ncbi:mesoderm induction early response protein 2 isoform X2 [Dunckerocampus dactyliophorus]|uniref:mesoderm induction early response protein 2 isoform X2 n=1 Tax=Dunckerocampus dactyliophorus TaxID=161453 RepID=UPI0024074447|nr:mesoderm induction early response protein 2 isoform X2 [Dunckerocampus dactyliophorus]
MAAESQTASELPLEDLLALYGYAVSDPAKQNCHVAATLPDVTLDKKRITEDIFPGEEGVESSADDLTPSVTSNASDLLQLPAGDKDTYVCSSDEDSDNISLPSNEEHKEIMVGSTYQATIPPLNPYAYQERAYTSEDQLLWRPDALPVQDVEEFLLRAQSPRGQEGAVCKQKCASTVRDNEQALYELVKCNFNADEALRRLRFNVKVLSEELCGWSEEECRNFEHGYKVYGKNFHLIQANKVRTRSVGECVEYYYMWKKSERHELFTQQATRITRKKCTLQSGSMEEGDQDGDAGGTEGSNNSAALLSRSSTISGKLAPPLPPTSSLELDKADEELLTGLCGDGCPQNPFGRPFPPSADQRDFLPGSCPAGPVRPEQRCAREDLLTCGDHHHPPGFFQFHVSDGPFVPEEADCGAAGDVTDPGWDFTCFGPPLPRLLTSCPPSLPLPTSDSTWENPNGL